MTWLFVTLLAYALFGLVSLGDKYLLKTTLPSPAVYAALVGLLGISILLGAPFLGIPEVALGSVWFILLVGGLQVIAIYALFVGLNEYEPSRIVPATGALIPVGTLILGSILFEGGEALSPLHLLAFGIIILGTVLLTLDDPQDFKVRGLDLAAITAFLFAVAFSFTKQIYEVHGLWPGFFWQRIGGVLAGLCIILFSSEVRRHMFERKKGKSQAGIGFILGVQMLGAIAVVLQNVALFLAPGIYAAFVNALEGTQYAFLLLYIFLARKIFPQVDFGEVTQKRHVIRKGFAICFITLGLALIAL